MEIASNERLGLLQIHLATLLFGFAGLYGKSDLNPAVLTAGRTFFGCLTLTLVGWLVGASFRLNSRFDFGKLFAAGAVLAVHWFSFFQSIQVSTVAIGLLAFASFPVFVVVLEPVTYSYRLRLFEVAMAVVVVAGLAIITPSFDLRNQSTQGVCWGLFSGLTFAIYSLLCRTNVHTHPQLVVNVYQQGAALLVILTLWLALPSHGNLRQQLNGQTVLKLAVLGIVLTAGAQTLYIGGLKFVRAQTTSIITCLEPVYGILLAVPLAGKAPTARTAIGGFMIIGAVIATTWQTANRAPSAEEIDRARS